VASIRVPTLKYETTKKSKRFSTRHCAAQSIIDTTNTLQYYNLPNEASKVQTCIPILPRTQRSQLLNSPASPLTPHKAQPDQNNSHKKPHPEQKTTSSPTQKGTSGYDFQIGSSASERVRSSDDPTLFPFPSLTPPQQRFVIRSTYRRRPSARHVLFCSFFSFCDHQRTLQLRSD
jgi:hypothetical protein